MNNRTTQVLLFIVFIGLTYFYFKYNVGFSTTDKIFITITTFFFSIFTGFFIARQGNRYTKIREVISTFDGKLSSIYRASQNINPQIQEKIGLVIKNHYTLILQNKAWNYHFINKSNTISSIHEILEEDIGNNKQETLRNQAVGRVMTGLSDCQVLRKNMVMLYQERIPSFQWFLLFFFVLILLSAISVIPSQGFILGALLKSAFVVSILSVIFILRNLDNLHLFEEFIGENSAKDVLDLIEGNK